MTTVGENVLSRRDFLRTTAACTTTLVGGARLAAGAVVEADPGRRAEPFLLTRGIIPDVYDLENFDWPERAKAANLTTIGTHITPSQVAAFMRSEAGQRFWSRCAELGIAVEHELHAMGDLLPSSLFEKDRTLFRMNGQGERVADWNCCVHSGRALSIICENAVKYAKICRSTTGRYFYWIDDSRPMCRCRRCRAYSDTDQALILENRICRALQRYDKRAKLAHLCYKNTIVPPKQVKPEKGIFLEFAPIERVWNQPLSQSDARRDKGTMTHGRHLEVLDQNLEVFGADDAQVLEYWMDVSLFSRWNRKKIVKIPWHRDVFLDDLQMYAKRGVRHVTSFGVYISSDYVNLHGEPPLRAYGEGLFTCQPNSTSA